MKEFHCSYCGKSAQKASGAFNRLARQNSPMFCSRECSYASRRTGRLAIGWHAARFEERDGAVHSPCAQCGKSMWLPPSKVADYKHCGPICQKSARDAALAARSRPCETCGVTFSPRPNLVANGWGRYCSQKCNKAFHDAGQRPEVWAARVVTMREKRERGEWTVMAGEKNGHWKGGKDAALARRRDSGKAAAGLRAYRAKNPHKVREFATRRKSKKLGRLPYGTIPAIGNAQRWRCAICRTEIRKGYHVDHIMPIARGGKHEKSNIQLLCPPCNLRKSDRDPIAHMQSLGRLL